MKTERTSKRLKGEHLCPSCDSDTWIEESCGWWCSDRKCRFSKKPEDSSERVARDAALIEISEIRDEFSKINAAREPVSSVPVSEDVETIKSLLDDAANFEEMCFSVVPAYAALDRLAAAAGRKE